MNERVKELATEVGISVDYLNTTKQWILIEALAELIVRECADIVEETRWMVPPSQEQIARSIKQHFGVES